MTTWNHTHFPHFDADDVIKKMRNSLKGLNEKYKGMTDDDIKKFGKEKRTPGIGCYIKCKSPEFLDERLLDETKIIPETACKAIEKECIEILRKEHNIFEETIYKIERTDKKNPTKSQFDLTISDFSRYN